MQAIIHFAALKAVGESVEKPLDYYHNNFESLINLLRIMGEFAIPNLVFHPPVRFTDSLTNCL